MADFQDEISNFIYNRERDYNIKLSEEARQLLTLPLLEYNKISKEGRLLNEIDYDRELLSWRDSVDQLLRDMAEAPARIDTLSDYRRERTSFSVIKAFASRFCNIPPFCKER